jgi:hypothetical protein
VKKRICTKELNCFQGISMEKDFEMSAIELVDYGYVITIYAFIGHLIVIFGYLLKTLN